MNNEWKQCTATDAVNNEEGQIKLSPVPLLIVFSELHALVVVKRDQRLVSAES